MKKLTVLCLAAALVAGALSAGEMTLDELLAAHFEALGGAEALAAVESAQFNGNMAMGPGMEVPFTMVFSRPMSMRLEFTMQGMTAVQAYDGETAWSIMPFMGKTDPEVMADDQAKNIKEQADFDGPLMNWEEKGHQIELMGLEETDGTEAYKLKVSLANGDERYHYLDSEYFILIKQEGKTTMQGAEVEFETILSDYKEVDGLMFPHSIESRPKGQPHGQVITIESIELGVDVNDEMFAMPEAAPEAATGTDG
jgi:outer membrane lipoprotein-sorting protein